MNTAQAAREAAERWHRFNLNYPELAERALHETIESAIRVSCESDWITESEVALRHARNALLKAPEWHQNYLAQQELAIAIQCLKTAIASNP